MHFAQMLFCFLEFNQLSSFCFIGGFTFIDSTAQNSSLKKQASHLVERKVVFINLIISNAQVRSFCASGLNTLITVLQRGSVSQNDFLIQNKRPSAQVPSNIKTQSPLIDDFQCIVLLRLIRLEFS